MKPPRARVVGVSMETLQPVDEPLTFSRSLFCLKDSFRRYLRVVTAK